MGAKYVVRQHESAEPFWFMGMKLRAQGKSADKVEEARIQAMREVRLGVPQCGMARYFLPGVSEWNSHPRPVVRAGRDPHQSVRQHIPRRDGERIDGAHPGQPHLGA